MREIAADSNAESGDFGAESLGLAQPYLMYLSGV
jgi:hypothetical protein